MKLLKKQKIEKDSVSYRDVLDEVDFIQFFKPKTNYFMFLKHEDLISFESCINVLIHSLAYKSFESRNSGLISDAKTKEMTLEEAISISSKNFLVELNLLKERYKSYPSLNALSLKLRKKEYLTKEVYFKYNKTLNQLNKLFSNPYKVLSLYKEMFPENERNFILDNNNVIKPRNPLSEETKFYSVESDNFKVRMFKYDISYFYFTESYDNNKEITFNITYQLTTPNKEDNCLTLELKSKNNVEGYYLQEEGIELFFNKSDAIEKLKEINIENKKYIDTL